MILILMGVSGAGKTTVGELLARDLGWPFYDGDDFHPQANIDKMRAGIPLTDVDRDSWLAALRRVIDQLLRDRRSAIMACSALKQTYRQRLQGNDPDVHFVYLKGDPALIHRRLQERQGHFMKAGLLDSQFGMLEEPHEALTVRVSHSPQAIVKYIKNRFDL